MELIIDRTMLKTNAHQKFLTLKPAKILSTNNISNALITKRKSPKVIMVSGMVRNTNIGLITAVTNPINKAVIIAVKKFFTLTPFSK